VPKRVGNHWAVGAPSVILLGDLNSTPPGSLAGGEVLVAHSPRTQPPPWPSASIFSSLGLGLASLWFCAVKCAPRKFLFFVAPTWQP